MSLNNVPFLPRDFENVAHAEDLLLWNRSKHAVDALLEFVDADRAMADEMKEDGVAFCSSGVNGNEDEWE